MLERSIVPNMTLAEITALHFDHDAKEKYWCNFFPAKSCTTACGFCSVVVFINGKTIYLDNKTSLEIPRVRRIEPFINLQPLP